MALMEDYGSDHLAPLLCRHGALAEVFRPSFHPILIIPGSVLRLHPANSALNLHEHHSRRRSSARTASQHHQLHHQSHPTVPALFINLLRLPGVIASSSSSSFLPSPNCKPNNRVIEPRCWLSRRNLCFRISSHRGSVNLQHPSFSANHSSELAALHYLRITYVS